MPTLYIMSLFEPRERKFGARLSQVRQELARYLDAFEAKVGTETAGILRAYAAIPVHDFLKSDSVPEGQPDEPDGFTKVRWLKETEAVLARRLYSSPCCYRERSKPPYVLWCYGISWDDIKGQVNDGKLPVEEVRRLLDIMRNTKMRLPTAEELELEGHGNRWETHPVERRHELLKWARRRLLRLLGTAAKLGEDVTFTEKNDGSGC